jgi:hypothetical protein
MPDLQPTTFQHPAAANIAQALGPLVGIEDINNPYLSSRYMQANLARASLLYLQTYANCPSISQNLILLIRPPSIVRHDRDKTHDFL